MLRRLPRVLTLATTALIVGALLTMACTPVELVSPSARASPAGTLAVAEMLPTALHGEALVELPGLDPTTGALNQLVRRLDKTSADVEAAGRIAPDEGANRAFVHGVRIAGVDGARLLAEDTALIREILTREAQADVPADVISLGGKRVTRLVPPLDDEPLYLLVSQDTIFLIGGANELEADELIRQIP
jgi:hypothetical protein